jgi:hypothetical protein
MKKNLSKIIEFPFLRILDSKNRIEFHHQKIVPAKDKLQFKSFYDFRENEWQQEYKIIYNSYIIER